MGVRYFRAGRLEREFSVNERGNREGVSREWNVADGARVLVREESQVNGKTTGVVRSRYPGGQRRRLGFYGNERKFVERGALVRDDEVFEDGPRKSAGQ